MRITFISTVCANKHYVEYVVLPHSQAFYRRAEASRLLYQDMVRRGVPGTARALDDSIRDYCDCFCLTNAHTKSISEAIVLAVDNCETEFS